MVKIISDKPSITLIEIQDLNPKNLTAHFHKAEYSRIAKDLDSSNLNTKYLKDLVSKISLGNTGKIMDGYVNKGVPYLTTKNITENGVDLSRLTFITKEVHNNKLKNSKVYPKDILYNKSGNVGLSAIIPNDYEEYNLVSDLIYIRPIEERVDPYYLVLFLNSKIGKKLSEQQAGGAIFQHISIYDVGDLKIPIPNKKIQKYFADKIRKAEYLIEEAKRLKEEAELVLNKELKIKELLEEIATIKEKSVYVNPDIIIDRLDSKVYQKEYLLIEKHLKQFKQLKLKEVIKKINNGIENRDFVKEGKPYLRIKDLNKYEINYKNIANISKDQKISPKGKVNLGDLIISRSGSIGIVKAISNYDLDIIISSHIIKLTIDQNKILPNYLSVFLNSILGQLLIERISYGAVQKEIGQDDLQNISIPILDKEIQKQINHCIIQFEKNRYISEELILEAKNELESLLEGTFDESKVMN